MNDATVPTDHGFFVAPAWQSPWATSTKASPRTLQVEPYHAVPPPYGNSLSPSGKVEMTFPCRSTRSSALPTKLSKAALSPVDSNARCLLAAGSDKFHYHGIITLSPETHPVFGDRGGP